MLIIVLATKSNFDDVVERYTIINSRDAMKLGVLSNKIAIRKKPDGYLSFVIIE